MLGRTLSAARWLRVGLALLAPVALVAPFGACGLDTQGSPAECKQDLDCIHPDQPCRVFRCEESACLFTALPDGDAPTQVKGDCQLAQCKNGENISVDKNDDDDDVNDCTAITCTDGVPSVEQLSNKPCHVGQAVGLCNAGECVVTCDTGSDCNDSNDCTDGQCNEGTCDFTPKHGFVLPDTNEHDCRQNICNQDDDTATIPSLTETPEDNNVCTADTCVNGVPTFTPTPRAKCGADDELVCDPSGACVGCFEDDQCAEPTVCMGHHCDVAAKQCVDDPVPADTETATGQTEGDCKKVVCDGMGNTLVVNDDGDPDETTQMPDDCLKPGCSNGIPGNAFEAMGTTCNMSGGKLCNATGNCVACLGNGDCPAQSCKTVTCVSGACQYANIGDGQDDPTDTCSDQGASGCGQNGQCNGSGGCKLYPSGTQCAPATCSNATATPARTCNGTGTCNPASGTMCMNHFECDGNVCATTCNDDNDCVDGWECGSGGQCRVADGEDCPVGGPSQCASGVCEDGVCCDMNCMGSCRRCDLAGTEGTCTNVPNNTESGSCNGTQHCNGSGMCVND